MSSTIHPIRLVAGFEIRPPAPGCDLVLERQAAERLGPLIADDLSACVSEVTGGHLVVGPALLEPGQVLSPNHAPWRAMREIARLEGRFEPGVTSIGAVGGRLSHDVLAPYREPPDGLFVCLPLLLVVEGEGFERAESALESRLFDLGGLKPPAMGTLAEITGLDPVHGQLMTLTDLMALVKMQLAGAGLDPFWPPVEHALLSSDKPAELDLPAGLKAHWNTDAAGWELEFKAFDGRALDDYALWIRAFRQTTALLESHLIAWRAVLKNGSAQVDDDNRWVRDPAGSARGPNRACFQPHDSVGLIACSAVLDGELAHYYPLFAGAVGELEAELAGHGIESIAWPAEAVVRNGGFGVDD